MERRLTTILASDVVGYSRLMGEDEAGTLAALKSHRKELFEPKAAQYNGRTVKLMGDGALMEFTSVVDAVAFAIEVQSAMPARNAPAAQDRRIVFRIGINIGDIIVEGDDIYGDGVNVAARMETLAEPGGICISSIVHESIGNRIEAEFTDDGAHEVKNIDRPIRVFRWHPETSGKIEAKASGKVSAGPPGGEPLAIPDKPSIVILPFDNLSGDKEQDYFADGMVEAITAALGNISSLFVIARNTAFTYKGRPMDVRDIGAELGVRYVLEGSVQRAGNRVRITTQLIETEGGTHVWAKPFDGSIEDIFELQDAITEQVAGALLPSIQLAEIERVRRKRPQDYRAYDFTMQAFPHVWSLERQATDTGLKFLQQALDMDSDYPLALSLAAWCHAQRAVYNWVEDIEASQAEALRLAEKAANLSGNDPLVLSVLGTVHTIVRNHGTARILLERAVSIDPNAAWTWSRLGWLETYADNPEVALAHFDKSRRLSPLDPMTFNTYVGMASAYQGAGDYEQAIGLFRRALEERPNAAWIYRSLAWALVDAGRIEEAKAAYALLMESYPDLTADKIRKAMVFSPEFMDRMLANLKTLGLPD
ncbi:MAG: tetratricopeptide repeat protein [Alphaproteobacteria bacterium]|nr:MAG: tetratricopeptide repeat protein [Alphaproteobacteria bacterium]